VDEPGRPCVVSLQLPDRALHVAVWLVRVGRVALYLMDTDLEANAPWDRELSSRLYGGDQETRRRQEILLGIGGVRLLRALGIVPAAASDNAGRAPASSAERPPVPGRLSWPTLLRPVFAIDVLACPRCGGRLRVIATVEDPVAVRQILAARRPAEPLGPGPSAPAGDPRHGPLTSN